MKSILTNIVVIISCCLIISCGNGDDESPSLTEAQVEELLNTDLEAGEGELVFNNGVSTALTSGILFQRNPNDSYSITGNHIDGSIVYSLQIAIATPPLQSGSYALKDIGGVLIIGIAGGPSGVLLNNWNFSLSERTGSITFSFRTNEVSISFDANVNNLLTTSGITHVSGSLTGRK